MANSFQSEAGNPELALISELAENIVYRLRGCDDVMVRKTIREVYREFCHETKCLTADRIIELVPHQAEYQVSANFGGVVTEIRTVALNGTHLRNGIQYRVENGVHPTIVLSPQYVFYPPEAHRLERLPEATLMRIPPKLFVKAVEVPGMESEKAPRWFIDRHGDAIVCGVLARLYSMQGRAWSDNAKASEERIRYENAKSETRMFKEVPDGGHFIDTSEVL